MTFPAAAAATGGTERRDEGELVLRVLSALLREDVVGLRTRSTKADLPDGGWLRLETPGPDALLLPVRGDGFQCEWAARQPLLRRESTGTDLASCDDILAALRELAPEEDRSGFDAFTEECRQALTTVRLHASSQDQVLDALTARYGADPSRWAGLGGSLAHDTLAARHDHPVYPTGRGRSGLGSAALKAYAPEFHPRFALRWLVLPRDLVSVRGRLPFPTPASLGLPWLDGTGHLALPVHPLTAEGPLGDALRTAGLDKRAVLAEQPYLDVVPTLSMRTVALADTPGTHLKLPLATSSLGKLNRRTIKPGTLADGAAVQRLIESVIAREPRFRDSVLHADETSYAHAGHELLAVLVRRWPAGLDGAVVVPLAALLSTAPDGRPVLDHLAGRFYGGDRLALLDAALSLLIDWATTLIGYGIALESHQQNVSLALDEHAGRPRIRLLFKDNDGPRINRVRLASALGEPAPLPSAFDDPRIVCDSDRPVAALFTTITVHLCAAAYAFELDRLGHAPLDALLGLVRTRLAEAAERLGTGTGDAGAVVREHVLDAAELPVKAMVTAGTLLSKARSGASDINKHYTTGPNYLLRGV
ncbi:IucA/IucC family protein [Streptomyces sp. NPDC127084]|uniref:IucA/IucC family protein n=1 Tax=Streptomyces sp. NPDC127084 TaxID=3347133 RepID=UPI003649EDFE